MPEPRNSFAGLHAGQKITFVFLVNLVLAVFSEVFTNELSTLNINPEWITSAGIAQDGLYRDIFLTSEIKTGDSGGGLGFYNNRVIVFGNAVWSSGEMFLQAGNPESTGLPPWLLTNGSYTGEGLVTPEKRLLGARIRAGNENLSLELSRFYLPMAISMNDYDSDKGAGFALINSGFKNSWIHFFMQVGLAGFSRLSQNNSPKLFALGELDINNHWKFRSGFLENSCYLFSVGYNDDRVHLDLSNFESISPNNFSAQLYRETGPWWFSLWSNNFQLKISLRNNIVRFRSNLYHSGFGIYSRADGSVAMAGIYFRDYGPEIRPYASFASGIGPGFAMTSLGVSLGKNWLFCFTFIENFTSKNYPLDPVSVPPELFFNGYSDSLTFPHSLKGFQVAWNSGDLFLYGFLAQNYPDFSFEHVQLVLLLIYKKEFG